MKLRTLRRLIKTWEPKKLYQLLQVISGLYWIWLSSLFFYWAYWCLLYNVIEECRFSLTVDRNIWCAIDIEIGKKKTNCFYHYLNNVVADIVGRDILVKDPVNHLETNSELTAVNTLAEKKKRKRTRGVRTRKRKRSSNASDGLSTTQEGNFNSLLDLVILYKSDKLLSFYKLIWFHCSCWSWKRWEDWWRRGNRKSCSRR